MKDSIGINSKYLRKAFQNSDQREFALTAIVR